MTNKIKCKKCGKEATPVKDFLESQGGYFIIMYWCYDCDIEVKEEWER